MLTRALALPPLHTLRCPAPTETQPVRGAGRTVGRAGAMGPMGGARHGATRRRGPPEGPPGPTFTAVHGPGRGRLAPGPRVVLRVAAPRRPLSVAVALAERVQLQRVAGQRLAGRQRARPGHRPRALPRVGQAERGVRADLVICNTWSVAGLCMSERTPLWTKIRISG